jgi:hypothetical protein
MKRALCIVAILALFLITNRAAFEGYFSDDDLDNLSWATVAGLDSFVEELVSPVFSKTNTRPTGALFYRISGLSFGLQFERYIPPLFALHLLNCALIFWLLKRKGAIETDAAAATVFFLFHASLLEAWWKPMYIFDLLAATFCLITWLVFQGRFWPLALLSFWLAYKSKEVALFFPVVLALDQWRRSLPFFMISANFGLQAMQVNAQRDTAYTLRLTRQSLLTTIPFYAKQAVMNKFGAALLLPLTYLAANREFLKAMAGMLAIMIPLLLLPGRLFGVYLYLPLIALLPGLAAIFSRIPRRVLAAGLLAFAGICYLKLKETRKAELALSHETRAYIGQLAEAHRTQPLATPAYFENAPLGLRLHGMTGALRLITKNPAARVLNPEKEEARLEAKDRDLPTLSWFSPTKRLTVISHRYGEAKLSGLDFADPASSWQLTSGWYDREGNSRWASRSARLRLNSEAAHTKLRIRYNNGPAIFEAIPSIEVQIFVDGQHLATSRFDTPGTPTIDYPLTGPKHGPVEIEVRASPGFRPAGDGRDLGVALLSAALVR